TLDF
ncbi:hypothetical protein MPH_14034, partial [Macrophomina phaseolina MS6]